MPDRAFAAGPSCPVVIARIPRYQRGEIRAAMEAALRRLESAAPLFRRGERILLKPNLLLPRAAEKAVTTHPQFVLAAVELLLDRGLALTLGDSPGLGSAEKALAANGLLEPLRRYPVRVVNFEQPWRFPNPQAASLFHSFELDKNLLECDGVVNLPKWKTHGQMVLTLCVKNLFGLVVGKKKLEHHLSVGRDYFRFARMLVELHDLVSPRLHLLDGIVALEGNGPSAGTPRPLGLFLAGTRGHAVDLAVCRILGLDPYRLPTISALRPEEMPQVVYPDLAPAEVGVSQFRLAAPSPLPAMGLPSFLIPLLERWLATHPRADERCVLCRRCVEQCPTAAISLGPSLVEFDLRRCIRCYCCQEICPQGAIAVATPRLRRWLERYGR